MKKETTLEVLRSELIDRIIKASLASATLITSMIAYGMTRFDGVSEAITTLLK